MRIAVCPQPGRIELRTAPVPALTPEAALVRVSLCGICGSDVAAWRGSADRTDPYSPGHEFCGTVDKLGPEVAETTLGRRVVVDPNLGCGRCRYCRDHAPNLCDVLKSRPVKSNGGLSEFVALDHRMVHPLPDSLPDALAPFIEPLSCALHAARRAQVEAGGRTVILGAVGLGLLVGLVLTTAGHQVMFVELDAARRTLATALLGGAAMSPQQAAAADLDGGLDRAVDCTGSAAAAGLAVRVLRKGGRLVLAGTVEDSAAAPLPLGEVTMKELTVTGSWLNPNTFAEAIALATEQRLLLQSLPTRTFALEDVGDAFAAAARQEAAKVLVSP